MTTPWKMTGDYLESCTCAGACPCLYAGSPTEGDCTALVGWHIDKGYYGDVSLDDLNVAIALYSPGAMPEGNWSVVLYMDDRADTRQEEALGTVFGGQAGGHPALLATFIGEVKGIERAPVSYITGKGHRHLQVGDSAQADITSLEGQEGRDVTIHDHPFAVAPGHPLTVAQSTALQHQAHGIHLEHSGRTAFHSPFDYAGP